MKLNIGPWWLYDLILIIFLFYSAMRGMKKGIWRTMYFFLGEVVIILIISFVPQLIVNPTLPSWEKFSNLIGLSDLVGNNTFGLNSLIETVFSFIGIGVENVDTSGVSNEFLITVISIFAYFIVSILMFIGLHIILWIMYGIFGKRIKRAKVNRNVDMVFGLTFGIFFGLIWVGAVTPIISLPIFELSHQKLFTLTSTENSEDFFNENQYKKYSATSYLTFASPVGLIGFNYNLACLSKYALLPVMSLLEKNDQSSEEEIYENLTINMENTIIDGYSKSGWFDLSIKSCLEKAPVSSKNTMRFIPELMLSLSGVDFNNLPEETPQTRAEVPGINFSKTDAQANLLFASFDEYKIQKNFAPNQKFTKSNFVDWFEWSSKLDKNDQNYNQFLIAKEQIDRENVLGRKLEILSVLSSGSKTYEVLKNIYNSNSIDQRPGLIDFLPNLYFVSKVMNGLEVVPSGVVSEIFGHYYDQNGWSFEVLNFGLKNYMEYVGD